jgi:hypothetical protein
MDAVDWWARCVALASVCLSVLSLGWAVVSFRRGGSRLRVHAFLYGEVLLLWIFNAGRTQDTIERIVVGGRRGGIAGQELTEECGAPFTLAPGESRRLELSVTVLESARLRHARAGWDSVWLLLGSMRQRRAELLPIRHAAPPRVGWRLAPRTANARRYLPVMAAVAAYAIAAGGPARSVGAAVLMPLVGCRLYAGLGKRASTRLRVERRFCFLGAPLALVTAVAPASRITAYLLAGYLGVAVLLAKPGAITGVTDQVRPAVAWLRRTRSPA